MWWGHNTMNQPLVRRWHARRGREVGPRFMLIQWWQSVNIVYIIWIQWENWNKMKKRLIRRITQYSESLRDIQHIPKRRQIRHWGYPSRQGSWMSLNPNRRAPTSNFKWTKAAKDTSTGRLESWAPRPNHLKLQGDREELYSSHNKWFPSNSGLPWSTKEITYVRHIGLEWDICYVTYKKENFNENLSKFLVSTASNNVGWTSSLTKKSRKK